MKVADVGLWSESWKSGENTFLEMSNNHNNIVRPLVVEPECYFFVIHNFRLAFYFTSPNQSIRVTNPLTLF